MGSPSKTGADGPAPVTGSGHRRSPGRVTHRPHCLKSAECVRAQPMRTPFPKVAALAAFVTVLSACPAPPPPDPPVLPPVITAFTADKTMVTTGAAVKLSFTAERATD